MAVRLSERKVLVVIGLLDDKHPHRTIAALTGISHRTVGRIASKYGRQRRESKSGEKPISALGEQLNTIRQRRIPALAELAAQNKPLFQKREMNENAGRWRAAVAEVSGELFLKLRVGLAHLPPKVKMTVHSREVDRDSVLIRLEGDGLPERFVVQEGGPIERAVLGREVVDGIIVLNVL